MKKIATFIFCLLAQLAIAQVVFHNYSDAGFGYMIRTPENDMVVNARTYYGSTSELWKLDADGNVIWSTTLPVSPNTYIKRISITNDNSYLVSGITPIVPGNWKLVFIKVSFDGNILATTYPTLPKLFHIDNAFQLPDQSFVAVGTLGNFGTPNYGVLRMDSTLTNVLSLVEHQVESDTLFDNWQNLGNSYLSQDKESVVSISNDQTVSTSINSDSYIIKSDINGQILWKTKIDNGQQDDAVGIKSLADNSILVTGITNQDIETTFGKLLMFITKLNANGEVIWQRFFDSTGVGVPFTGVDLIEMTNGDLLITCRKIGGPKDNIFLLLTDANGVEKNRLLIERNDHDDYPVSTVLLDNNTLAITGSQDRVLLYRNFLVLLPFAILSDAKEVTIDSPLFEVFPNPSEGNVSIQYKNQSLSKTALQLAIYTSAGNKIYAGDLLTNFDFKNSPSGAYYFVLTDQHSPKSFVRRVVKN